MLDDASLRRLDDRIGLAGAARPSRSGRPFKIPRSGSAMPRASVPTVPSANADPALQAGGRRVRVEEAGRSRMGPPDQLLGPGEVVAFDRAGVDAG